MTRGFHGVFHGALLATLLALPPPAAGQGGPGNPTGLIDLSPAAATSPRAAKPDKEKRRATAIDDVQPAWSGICAEIRKEEPRADGVLVWRYSRTKVMCLNVRATMYTTILLPEFDKVVDYYVGDDTAFKVVQPPKRQNVLLVKPTAEMVEADTQLTVIGQAANGAATAENAPWGTSDGGRNVYTFYLRSYPVKSKQVPDLTVFIMADRPGGGIHSPAPAPRAKAAETMETAAERTRPKDKDRDGKAPARAPDYVREVPFDVDALSFDSYTVFAKDQDSVGIAPERVFTDGVFTFMDFGERRADSILRPVVFRVIDKIDTKVNTRTVGPRDNILVVEAVGNLTLRNGERVVCLRYRVKPRPANGVIVGTLGGEDDKSPATNPAMPVHAPPPPAPEPFFRGPPAGGGAR